MNKLTRRSNLVLARRWRRSWRAPKVVNSMLRGTHDGSKGANSAVSGFLRHGCFTPETGHWLARLARPKSATSRLMHRSKKQSADEQISAKA
jgi:hypothetical protein